MIFETIVGLSSVACFCLPVAVIVFYRLYRHTSLIALMVYYSLTILRCFGSSHMPPSPDLQNTWEVLYNYIEVPLMLSALLFFCPARRRQQSIHCLLCFFVIYEAMIALLFGFTPQASLYLMLPGLLMIVAYSLYLFIRQVRFTLLHGKNPGRVLMLAAVLFSYGCYLFMFYAYFALGVREISGIYAVHFTASSLAAVMMGAGLFLMRRRIRCLQELTVTRRELQMVFGTV